MKVADIVREFDARGSIKNSLFHGKVRGIVETPKEFRGITLVSGSWAVLELYAITCKGENIFGFGESTYLTPRSTILFVLNDTKLVGKLVTISGERGRGLDLRRQNSSSNRLGFSVPVFSKSSNDWVIKPNVVEPFKKTNSKEINQLFKEFSSYEPYYLPITKSVMGFDGSESYSYIETKKISSGSISYETNFNIRTSKVSQGILEGIVSGAESSIFNYIERSKPNKEEILGMTSVSIFLEKIRELSEGSNILIPNTNIRLMSLLPNPKSTYRQTLETLLGISLDKTFEEELLFGCPHYYYLTGDLDFDLAEKIFFISKSIHDKSFKGNFHRSVALVVEGARRTYINRGHSMLLDSLSSPLTCKVSKELQFLYRENGTPVSKEVKGLLGYLYSDSSEAYKELYSDGMYYSIEDSNLYLKDSKNFGFIVEPKKGYYSLTSIARAELDLIDSCSNFYDINYDFEMEDLQPNLDYLKDKYSTEFTAEQLRSLINLNTGFGLFLGTNHSGFSYIQEAIHRTFLNKCYSEKVTVIGKSFNIPKWLRDYSESSEYMNIAEIQYHTKNAEVLYHPGIVFVNDSHTMNIDELVSIFDYVQDCRAVYLFGNPWSSSGVFSTLASKFPSAVVLPNKVGSPIERTLSSINSKLCLSTGKDLKISSVATANTIVSLKDLVSRSLEKIWIGGKVRVISDLEKSMSYQKLGTKLLKEFIPNSKESELGVGVRVFSSRCTYELKVNGISLGSYTGHVYGEVTKSLGDFAVVSLGDDYSLVYEAIVPWKCLYSGYCVPSRVGEFYPSDVAFVVCSRNNGLLCSEDIIRSLDSASGVSFVGTECIIRDAPHEHNKLPVTLIGGIL